MTASSDASAAGELLRIGDVSARFGVSPSTVRRWHAAGKLTAIRTLGNQRRFAAADVERLISEAYAEAVA